MPNKKVKTAVGLLIAVATVYFLFVYEPKPYLEFDHYDQKLVMVKGTVFNKQKLELATRDNKWGVIRNGMWVEIATPYELEFNNYNVVILESGGRIYLVRNDRLTRSQMRWMDNEWRHEDSTTGEWLKFPDSSD